MAASKRSKTPHAAINPRTGPRTEIDPASHRGENPVWQVGTMDLEAPWTFKALAHDEWWSEVHSKLKWFETMTWQEIMSQTGGPRQGTNSHFVSVDRIIPEAQDRLRTLHRWEDLDQLFSLRLTGRCRIWGILVGHTLKLLWYDPHHEVCPSLN